MTATRQIITVLLTLLIALTAHADTRVWDPLPGNVNWSGWANWSPVGVPTNGDAVHLSSPSLTVMDVDSADLDRVIIVNGSTLNTGGKRLTVAGDLVPAIQVAGQNSTLIAEQSDVWGATAVDTRRLRIGTFARMRMLSALVFVSAGEAAAVDVEWNASIEGNGILTALEAYPAVVNNGSIIASGGGTLRIRVTDGGTLDLDGDGGGMLEATSGTDLVLDGAMHDAFKGTLVIRPDAYVSFFEPWVLHADGAVIMNGAGEPASLDGTDLTVHGFVGVYGDGEIAPDNLTVASDGTLAVFNGNLNLWTQAELAGTIGLDNGSLTGAVLYNDNRIWGNGTIASGGLVNAGVLASLGGTLVVDTIGACDFDGPAKTGRIEATDGDIEIRLAPSQNSMNFQGAAVVGAGFELRLPDGFLILDGAGTLELRGGRVACETFWQDNFEGPILISGPAESTIDAEYALLRGPISVNAPLRLVGSAGIGNDALIAGTEPVILDTQASMTSGNDAAINAPFINGGTFAPGGNSNPDADVDGIAGFHISSYTQTATGALHMEVAGTQPDAWDTLNVVGAASLQGVLSVTTLPGADTDGAELDLITASSVSGAFDDTLLPAGMSLRYEADRVVLVTGATSGCAGDINGDGTVGVDDLVAIVLSWGWNPDHPADLNGDGDVDVDDLVAVMIAWGDCGS